MKLHNYQIRGSEFWLNNPRCYYAVDMGLGKTAMTLHALTTINKPALIVGPLRSIYDTWPVEIEKWGFELSYTIMHGKNKLDKLLSRKNLYLTNFESLPWLYDELYSLYNDGKKLPFEVCVIDEGSMIKAHDTKRIEILNNLRPIFPKYRVILSGTPAPNGLLDLWSQYNFLDDGESLGSNYYKFRRTHYNANPYNQYDFCIKEDAEEAIHKAVAPITFRLDEKDHLDLPPITYNYIPVKLDKKLMNMYDRLRKDFMLEINDVDHEAINAASLSMKLRQFLQGFLYSEDVTGRMTTEIHDEKINAFRRLVDEIGQPVLCAIQFRYEWEMLRKIYPDAPIIYGKTKSSDASRYIKEWNAGKLPILFCHPNSLSHGVNLQSGGCAIVWYCQTWSLERYQQFNKRLHRQGQKNGVVIHHLVVKNTIDDKVSRVLATKDITQRKLLDFLKTETNYA